MTKSIDHKMLREAFGLYPTGVTIVTSRIGERIHGMTANSFTSVSLDPPLLLICIDNRARMLEAIRESGTFGLSVLSREQQHISQHFARPGNQSDIAFGTRAGVPMIEGAIAHFACRLYADYAAGDHTIFLGEILECAHEPGTPLLFHCGGYKELLENSGA